MQAVAIKSNSISYPSHRQIISSHIVKAGLLLLIVASIFRGLAWSFITPPIYGVDEPQHFMYAENIGRSHMLRIEPSKKVPLNLWQLAHIEQFEEVRFRGHTLSLANQELIRQQIQSLNTSTQSESAYVVDDNRLVVTKANFNACHPPLYHLLVSLCERPLAGFGLIWQLSASRLLSIALGVSTVLLSFATGRTIWKDDNSILPLTLATLVSFQPMTTFTFSTVTNVSLDIALFSALLLLSVRTIYFGLTLKRGLLLGLIVSAGLLTRLNFLVAIPLLILLILWQSIHGPAKTQPKTFLKLSLLMFALPAMLSYWWYKGALSSGGDSLVHLFRGRQHPPPFNLIHYLCHYDWYHAYSRIMASYWGSFGWLQAHLPIPLLATLTAITVLSAIISIGLLAQFYRRHWLSKNPHAFAMLFLTFATLLFVSFYAGLDMRMNAVLGGWFTIRGQYYLPAIIGQMVWLVLSVDLVLPRTRTRLAMFWLSTAMIALNFYSLFGVLAPRCFGACDLIALCSRATLFQPINTATLLLFCTLFIVFSGLLLISLFLSSRQDSSNSPANEVHNHLNMAPAWYESYSWNDNKRDTHLAIRDAPFSDNWPASTNSSSHVIQRSEDKEVSRT